MICIICRKDLSVDVKHVCTVRSGVEQTVIKLSSKLQEKGRKNETKVNVGK
jgi:hypothetical protein